MSKTLGNATLSLASQGLSSLTNMAAAILAAQATSKDEFGRFSIALLTYAVIVPGIQALVSQELVLTTGTRDERVSRSRDALLFSVLVAAVVGLLLIGTGLFVVKSLAGVLLPLGLLLPFLQLQDTGRFAAAAIQTMRTAVVSDGLWLVLGVGSMLVLRAANCSSASAYVIAWAVSGSLSGLSVLKSFSAADGSRLSLRRYAGRHFLGYRFLGEFLAMRASSQILTVLLSVFVGYAATGGLRGATVLFGPLVVLILASSSFGIPIIRSSAPEHRERTLAALALLLAGSCVLLTLLLQSVPLEAGRQMLGATWNGALEFVLPVGAQLTLTSLSTAIFVALRMIAPRSTLKLRVVPAVLLPAFFFAGLAMGGAVGAAWGIAAGSGLQCLIAAVAFQRMRSHGLRLSDLV